MLAVGITAAVLVFTVASVFGMMSQLGHFVWRFATREPVATSAPYAIIDSVEEAEAISGVTIFEGREHVENFGTEGFWNMEDGYLDPFYAIDADISMGNITITGGKDFTLYIDQSGNLGGYSLKWEIQGDTLKIRDGSSEVTHVRLDGLGDLFAGGQKGVEVVVTVPTDTVLQKVTAKTDFGDVRLLDLDVEVKVTAKTNMGNVEGYELRTAEKVELKTDMGNVTFGMSDELYAGMSVELKTNLGDVEANMACCEEDCEYELETDLGQVSINGVDRGSKAKQKGSKACKLDAESDLGNVAVYFYDSQWQ